METGAKIKIAILAEGLGRRGVGTAIVLRKLIEGALARRDGFDIVLVGRKGSFDDGAYPDARSLFIKTAGLPKFSGFFSYLYFFLTTNEKFDIFLYPRPVLHPLFEILKIRKVARKIVVIFHGAPDNKFVKIFRTPANFINEFLIRVVGKYFIDVAVVVSDTAISQVSNYYGFSRDKIRRVYNGVDLGQFQVAMAMNPIDRRKLLSEKYNLDEQPYILSVSRLDPHKNIESLVAAFSLFKKTDVERNYKLVVVGGKHDPKYSEKVISLIDRLGLSGDISFVPYVDAKDLPVIYAEAALFVFLSLSEGFGMPVIEAMAAGVPVVCSNISSMPEVAGGAALLVNPTDSEEIKEKMVGLLSDPKKIDDLKNAGFRRAAEFSWSKMQQDYLDVFLASI